MFCRLPGQRGVIAPGYWVRGHLLEHHAAALPSLYILIFPTDRVLYQTSRVFSSPAHTPEVTHAPSFPQGDALVVAISPGKGSDHLANASVSGTARSKGRKPFVVIFSSTIFDIFLSSILLFKLYLAIS